MLKIDSVRRLIAAEYIACLTGQSNFVMCGDSKMIELIGTTFEADEPYIFGEPNYEYIDREIEWYKNQSLNVNDIPGETPKIWKQVADKDGNINSNYGWCIYSDDNHNQFEYALCALVEDKNTRRAEMIYTRPSIQTDYNKNGMSDFICTDAVSYFIRNDTLIAHVKMRSNDIIFGYRNDYAWQKYVLNNMASMLKRYYGHLQTKIIWTASSFHIYERHFKLLNQYTTEQLSK